MARVLILLAITSAAFGLVVFTAMDPELWDPWLKAHGVTRDDFIFERGLKLVLVVIVGIPLTALIHAIGRLGSNKSQTDIHGYKVLRLRAGTRWFMTVSCLGLAALFFAYPMVDPVAPIPWAFNLAGILCALAIPATLMAKVRYDGSTLSVPNSFGGRSEHRWDDLIEVREVPEMKHYLLRFNTGKTASISYRYAGLDELVEMLRSRSGASGTVVGPSKRRRLA